MSARRSLGAPAARRLAGILRGNAFIRSSDTRRQDVTLGYRRYRRSTLTESTRKGGTHTVAYTSSVAKDQIVMQPNAGPLSIELDRPSVTAWPGAPAEFKVRVRRDLRLQTPVRVELLYPGHLRGVEAAPIELPADLSEATVRVSFAAGAGPFNAPLVVRATARLPRAIDIRGTSLREGDEVTAVTSLGVVRARHHRF